MGVRLIRENSDTPNVTNKDDARMVRYAYGGQNGYVQKYGRELDYIPSGNIFTIGSGMAVLQGWEVVIDSNGWQLELSTSDVTKRYYLVYLEVNLTLGGSAEIKSKTDQFDYPTIEEGDDLTENLNGIAYLELYRFTATRGVVADVTKIVQKLSYTKRDIEDLKPVHYINSEITIPGLYAVSCYKKSWDVSFTVMFSIYDINHSYQSYGVFEDNNVSTGEEEISRISYDRLTHKFSVLGSAMDLYDITDVILIAKY